MPFGVAVEIGNLTLRSYGVRQPPVFLGDGFPAVAVASILGRIGDGVGFLGFDQIFAFVHWVFPRVEQPEPYALGARAH